MTELQDYEQRPVQNDDGTWDALDANGYGHTLGLENEYEVEIWLEGYSVGAKENM
jgi:bacillopeptidase F (M6 metalloprotease family)